jgi:predicted metal-dependent HD superfamily phosphohydrolase
VQTVTFSRAVLLESLAGVGVEPAQDIFAALASAYGESGRHYHNQRHVAECLKALSKFEHLAGDRSEIEIGIWFHDAVYDTRRGDNEERSALWAENFLRAEGVADEVAERIGNMIRATKSHQADDPDTRLLLDLDLGILGQRPEVFDTYDRAIRREYAWVPERRYREGRAAVLKQFLDRSAIYHHQPIRDILEAPARLNLENRLDELLG